MGRITYQIDLYKKLSAGSYEATPKTVSNIMNSSEEISIEASADTFDFLIPNTNRDFSTNSGDLFNFEVDDKVDIYIKSHENAFTAADLLINGIVAEIRHDISVDQRNIRMRGVNMLEKLTSTLWGGSYTNTEAWKIIVNLLGHVDDGQLDGLKFFSATTEAGRQAEWISWGNATDSTVLPSYNQTSKPVFQMVEELSRKEINLDADHYFYMDSSNHFRWVQKSNSASSTFTEGIDFTNIKANKSIWDVFTAGTVDCGLAPDGTTIHAGAYHETNGALYGLRWIPSLEVRDKAGPIIKLCKQQDGWGTDKSTNYPNAGEYDFTMPWKASHDHRVGGTQYAPGDTIVVTSDSEFNEEIRAEARWKGKVWLQGVLIRAGIPRWKSDLTVTGSWWSDSSGLNYPTVGSVYTIQSPSVGWDGVTAKSLRLKGATHSLDPRNGWEVDMHFEEDLQVTS